MTLLIAVFLALVLFFGQRKLFDKNWKRKLHVSLAFGEQGVYPGELCTLKQIIQNNILYLGKRACHSPGIGRKI